MDRALLSGADFTGAHLQSANLIGAILREVCFAPPKAGSQRTPRWRKADSNCRSHPDKAVSEQRWQPLCNARRFCAGTGTETSKDE
jgi:uncharacterized protein YjbI with pentapeptide repeats